MTGPTFVLMRTRDGDGRPYCGAGCGLPTARGDADRLAVHLWDGRELFRLCCDACARKLAPHLAGLIGHAPPPPAQGLADEQPNPDEPERFELARVVRITSVPVVTVPVKRVPWRRYHRKK